MTSPRTAGSRTRGRRILVVIGLVSLAPVVAAWLWWAVPGLWPRGTSNHGDLVQPPRLLRVDPLVTLDGRRIGVDELRRGWTLVYVGSDACDEGCRRTLYTMQRLKLAQGQKAYRVHLLFAPIAADDASIDRVAAEIPELVVLAGPLEALDAFRLQFTAVAGGDPVYLVDPLGNLMMVFDPELEPRLILEDLKRLLRVSRVG